MDKEKNYYLEHINAKSHKRYTKIRNFIVIFLMFPGIILSIFIDEFISEEYIYIPICIISLILPFSLYLIFEILRLKKSDKYAIKQTGKVAITNEYIAVLGYGRIIKKVNWINTKNYYEDTENNLLKIENNEDNSIKIELPSTLKLKELISKYSSLPLPYNRL